MDFNQFLLCLGLRSGELRLNELVERGLDSLRESLGQRVLMLNPEQGEAAGTTRHCLSCFKDRSQSPVRGTVGCLAMASRSSFLA